MHWLGVVRNPYTLPNPTKYSTVVLKLPEHNYM